MLISEDNCLPACATSEQASLEAKTKTLAGGEFPRLKTCLPASWHAAQGSRLCLREAATAKQGVLAFNLSSVRDFGRRVSCLVSIKINNKSLHIIKKAHQKIDGPISFCVQKLVLCQRDIYCIQSFLSFFYIISDLIIFSNCNAV